MENSAGCWAPPWAFRASLRIHTTSSLSWRAYSGDKDEPDEIRVRFTFSPSSHRVFFYFFYFRYSYAHRVKNQFETKTILFSRFESRRRRTFSSAKLADFRLYPRGTFAAQGWFRFWPYSRVPVPRPNPFVPSVIVTNWRGTCIGIDKTQ